MKVWRWIMMVSLLFGLFGCTGAGGTVASVESMTLTVRGMRGGYVYEIADTDGRCELRRCREVYSEGEDRLVLEASAVLDWQEWIALMNTCSVLRWDGFHGKHPKHVQDGVMFLFSASVNGGQTIRADGSANFPKGYHEFVQAMDAMLAEHNMAGTP